MSVVEDSRKVLQDFTAPELRAVSARLDAVEKKFDESKRRAEKRHDVMASIRQVIDWNSVQQRLARLESKESTHRNSAAYGLRKKSLSNRTLNSSIASSNPENLCLRISAAKPILRSVPTLADQ